MLLRFLENMNKFRFHQSSVIRLVQSIPLKHDQTNSMFLLVFLYIVLVVSFICFDDVVDVVIGLIEWCEFVDVVIGLIK